MSAMTTFDFEGAIVRVDLDGAGEPWWVLADVCEALGIRNSRDVASRLADDERGVGVYDTPGGPQSMATVNEAGLYRTMFRSTKPEAERFRRWVFHEVLPELRRTGRYEVAGAVTVDPPLVERETRYPDGRVVLERFGEVLRERPERRALPVPEPAADLEALRERFNNALGAELARLPAYTKLSAPERGMYRHQLNSRMKVLVRSPRDLWTLEHYEAAASWLLFSEGLDVRWALDPVRSTG